MEVWVWRGYGGVGIGNFMYISLHCHQNDSCIKMSNDESHFNISLIIARDKVKTVSTDYTL